jgi:hypothetical protein
MTEYIDKQGGRVQPIDVLADPVEFYPSGGGFLHNMPRARFLEEFRPAPTKKWRRATTSADWIDLGAGDQISYLPCWSDGSLWNGWGMPAFARVEVDYQIGISKQGGLFPMRWEGDNVVVTDEDGDYAIAPLTMPDGSLAWDIGAGSWCWDRCMVVPTLPETLVRMQKEVLDCISIGQVPETVASLEALADIIDINELGGFCEDELADRLIAHFGGRDEHEGMPQAMLDYINAAQAQLDGWLKAGGHKEKK